MRKKFLGVLMVSVAVLCAVTVGFAETPLLGIHVADIPADGWPKLFAISPAGVYVAAVEPGSGASAQEETSNLTVENVLELEVKLRMPQTTECNRITLPWEDEYDAYRTAGNIVTFGTYPQTAAGTDKTPIEWLVLDYDDATNSAMLISLYALDGKPYNQEEMKLTWEECTLRSWLNEGFYYVAFNQKEQSRIITTEVDNSQSQGKKQWKRNAGNNTNDKVYVLSYNEVMTLFDSEEASMCVPTAYAVKNGAFQYSGDNEKYKRNGEGFCYWWLRSPGSFDTSTAIVYYQPGEPYHTTVSDTDIAVRPVIWLDLSLDVL